MAHLSIVPYEDNPSHIESHLMFKAFVVKPSVNNRLCCRLYHKLSHTLALKHLLAKSTYKKRDIAYAIISFFTPLLLRFASVWWTRLYRYTVPASQFDFCEFLQVEKLLCGHCLTLYYIGRFFAMCISIIRFSINHHGKCIFFSLFDFL